MLDISPLKCVNLHKLYFLLVVLATSGVLNWKAEMTGNTKTSTADTWTSEISIYLYHSHHVQLHFCSMSIKAFNLQWEIFTGTEHVTSSPSLFTVLFKSIHSLHNSCSFIQPHCMLVKCNLKFGATDLKMSEPEDRVFCVEQGPFAPLIVACVESQKKCWQHIREMH